MFLNYKRLLNSLIFRKVLYFMLGFHASFHCKLSFFIAENLGTEKILLFDINCQNFADAEKISPSKSTSSHFKFYCRTIIHILWHFFSWKYLKKEKHYSADVYPNRHGQICPMCVSRVRFYYVNTLKVVRYCGK